MQFSVKKGIYQLIIKPKGHHALRLKEKAATLETQRHGQTTKTGK